MMIRILLLVLLLPVVGAQQLLALTGSQALDVTVTDLSFPSTLACFSRDNAVFLKNTGTAAITLSRLDLLDPTKGFFIIQPPPLPFTLEAGTTLRLPIRFSPRAAGMFSARLTVVVEDLDDPVQSDSLISWLSGEGRIIEAGTHIGSDYRAILGTEFTAPIILDDSLDEAMITRLMIRIEYDRIGMMLRNGMLDRLESLLAGTLLEGWSVNVVELRDGAYAAEFTAPPGQALRGRGPLLNPVFFFLHEDDYDEGSPEFIRGEDNEGSIRFQIIPYDRPCVTFFTSAGHVVLEWVSRVTLDPIEPNPVTGNELNTRLTVSVGMKDPELVTIALYMPTGELVGTLIDRQPYLSGGYPLRISTEGLAPGVYFLLLSSEEQREMKKVVVLR